MSIPEQSEIKELVIKRISLFQKFFLLINLNTLLTKEIFSQRIFVKKALKSVAV